MAERHGGKKKSLETGFIRKQVWSVSRKGQERKVLVTIAIRVKRVRESQRPPAKELRESQRGGMD